MTQAERERASERATRAARFAAIYGGRQSGKSEAARIFASKYARKSRLQRFAELLAECDKHDCGPDELPIAPLAVHDEVSIFKADFAEMETRILSALAVPPELLVMDSVSDFYTDRGRE